MKTIGKQIGMVVLAMTALTACKNKEAEKKIAAIEAQSKLNESKPPLPVEATAVAPETKPEGPLPAFQFQETDHDFGTISEGQKVSYTYKFKNMGEAPLIIQNAQPSCGCTVPEWSKEPVPVGGDGFVKVEFDSNGRTNIQNKTITVTANTWPKQTKLQFKAMVTPKSEAPTK